MAVAEATKGRAAAVTNEWTKMYRQVGRILDQARELANNGKSDELQTELLIQGLEDAYCRLTDLTGDYSGVVTY